MPLATVSELKTKLEPGRRVLGLDLGTRTVGMAISDPSLTVASPLGTIRRRRLAADLEELGRLVAEHGVGGFVIGLPISMDGGEGRRCQSVRQFAADLERHLGLDIAFWDERLSTAAVERVLIAEADMTRRRRRQVIDKMAAAYILQGALDAMGEGK